jgi:transposase
MPDELHSHYAQLLGLSKPWKVASVNLEIGRSRVVIGLDYGSSECECPECGGKRSIRDFGPRRKWRHLDTMNFETIIEAAVPRANCADCGVKTSAIPWAGKHSRFTLMFEAFAIAVLQAARSLDAGRKLLGLSWDSAHSIMERAVERGLERRDISEVSRVGIDEKSFLRGHSYTSILNDLDEPRVLEVVPERTEESARRLIMEAMPTAWSRFRIEAVAMDMWPPFTNAARDLLGEAEIVFDRFHVSKHLGEAVDQVRRAEHKELSHAGDRSLAGTRYSWLRSAATRTEKHQRILDDLCGRNLRTSRAWAIKESFLEFWESRNEAFAEAVFADWYKWAVRSRLRPVVKVAKMLKRHLAGLLSYFRHWITNAASEGLNSRIQSIKASARGFRSFANYRTRILFLCGKLDLKPA